jgi:hypothetical protein
MWYRHAYPAGRISQKEHASRTLGEKLRKHTKKKKKETKKKKKGKAGSDRSPQSSHANLGPQVYL